MIIVCALHVRAGFMYFFDFDEVIVVEKLLFWVGSLILELITPVLIILGVVGAIQSGF